MSFIRVSTMPALATAGLLLICLPFFSKLSREAAKPEPTNSLPPAIRTQTETLVRAWMPQYARWQLRGSIARATPYNCDVQVLTPDGEEVALYKWNIRSNSLSAYVRNDVPPVAPVSLTAPQAVRVATGWLASLRQTAHLSDWHLTEPPQLGAKVWRIQLQSPRFRALVWIDAITGRLKQYHSGSLTGPEGGLFVQPAGLIGRLPCS